LNTSTNVNECLELMRKLIEYRQQKALHHQLMKVAERSMLGIDAIVMLITAPKSAATIFSRLAHTSAEQSLPWLGAYDSGTEKKIIGIEREVPERPASALQGNFAAFRYFRPASLRKVHGSRSKQNGNFIWGWCDLNPGPPGPAPGALPS
jgi:hypothetical protein